MTIELFHHNDRLRATLEGERSVLDAKLAWAAPLSRPNRYLAVMDGKSEEVALLEDPERELSPASWQAAHEALRRRYLTACVTRILEARQEYGAAYFGVETDRGPRDFVAQNLSENAVWVSETHLLLLDVEGNRFEIPDLEALDVRSRVLLDGIV